MIKSDAPTRPATDDARDTAHPGWWTALAVIVVAWLGVPLLLPIAAAFPWFFFQRRHRDQVGRLSPVSRWALSVLVTGMAMLALAGHRATQSIPFAAETTSAVSAWLDGSGAAVPSWIAMAAWTGVFAVAAVASRGMAASIVLANVLLLVAVHAAIVFARAGNVFEASVVALPIWSAFQLAAMVVLLDPLTAWGEQRLWRRTPATTFSNRRLVIGGALLVAAFATRLLAGSFSDLARRLAS